ncbi:histidine phosphatase family protein [Lactobacillus jensenii]|uniref:histidine phosphatase family protein n=1 Tax=Lactobacillus jensenii TaxID=109790 RepID=UPI00119615FD|nr:histidine phosphatase family protein [Lactobacillus jensenii]MDK7161084.1 histidine phosphatase family protein [Lactobacillus jensenii]TVV13382.1 histidine phosphatase family protein [Lactobacillus jensenii]TVV15399.1 histidine phosphatase family protein [Lactobacillus jensenii]
MQIYFVRHGKTEWNLASKFQGGHGDSPLLPESYEDIKKLGNYLKGTKFRGIYASPLKRAFDTAQGVQQTMGISLPVHVEERLREFNLGDLEGMKFADAEKKYPKEIDDFWNHADLYDPSKIHGETYPEVIARGKDFAQEMAKLYPNKNDKILAVSHGGALCAIMGGLLGYPLAEIRKHGGLSNTSLTILEIDDEGKTFHKVVWNETSYLGRKLGATDSL